MNTNFYVLPLDMTQTIRSFTQPFRTVFALAVTGVVLAAAWFGTSWVPFPKDGFIPSSLMTHSVMALGTLGFILWFGNRDFSAFGFTMGRWRFHWTILLWVLPTALPSTAAALAGAVNDSPGPASGFSPLQSILFIWIVASTFEEFLTRGLLQTLLYKDWTAEPARHWFLSLPVILSGLFFGAMHLVLIPKMGAGVAPVIAMTTFLGWVTARYRERFNSLVPAIIIHALFNIGGMLPGWLI